MGMFDIDKATLDATLERYPAAWGLLGLGGLAAAWSIIKAALIGYYPDEFVPQIVLPAVFGVACLVVVRLLALKVSKESESP